MLLNEFVLLQTIYSMNLPSFKDVVDAHKRITAFIHRTPVLSCTTINRISEADIYFKCENFQKVGAFKYRGATNAVLQLSESQKTSGVATHSSGNHAAALALAASKNGVKSFIVMPKNAPEIKKNAVRGYGAEIIFCENTLESREETLSKVIEQTGATFIHPYNQIEVISGQGTAALELLNDVSELDSVLAPVGGGGLLSGTAMYSKGFNNKIKVFGAEPELADDACQSFHNGKLIPVGHTNTIADGLRTSLGDITFDIISNNVDDIYTVSEAEIIEAMQLVMERMKIVIEPSSAVPLAAVLKNKNEFKGKKVGIILSGGNVDLKNLPFKK